MSNISNNKIYLERMARPLQEKLKILKYFPNNPKHILDIGCADGAVTKQFAKLYPNSQILGVDINKDFINKANKNNPHSNLNFAHSYQRELLLQNQRYDVVIFMSVLHEFYSYGEGISTVVKALADAHELVKPKGRIIIRDMILSEYTKSSNLYVDQILSKIKNTKHNSSLSDFEKYYGKIINLHQLNHFLLKYMYTENWSRELKEHYVGVTFEDYEKIIKLLGLKLLYKQSYLISFLQKKWREDFALSKDELSPLRSTGILIIEKS